MQIINWKKYALEMLKSNKQIHISQYNNMSKIPCIGDHGEGQGINIYP